EGVDQCLLERAQVPVEILAVARQVEDRISDELARSVVCDVAAPLHLEHWDVTALEQVRFMGIASQRYDGRMLDQEQDGGRQPPLDSGLSQGALPLERLGVW